MGETTEAQIEALAEAIDYLESKGCSDDIAMLPELQRLAREGDRHAAYLAEVIGGISHITIEVPHG